MIRELDDKGLGQNKVLCSSSGVKLLMINYHAGSLALPAPGRQISGSPPASGFRTTLTRILPCLLFLVASSLSPFPCRLFLVASLGALLSASCWSPSFSLCRQLDCWYCRSLLQVSRQSNRAELSFRSQDSPTLSSF